MTFANPFGTKTPGVSTITAAEVTAAGVSIQRALDGTGGGSYTPSAPLIIGGSGMQIPSGATWNVLSGGTFQVNSGGALTVASGGTLTMGGTGNVQLASRSITRVIHSIPVSRTVSGAHDWDVSFPGKATSLALGGDLYIALRVPHGAVIASVSVYHYGAAGHVGAPTMPNLALYSISLTDVQTNIANANETWVDAATYEAVHALTVSSINHTVDRSTLRYLLHYNAESGGNGIVGDVVVGASVTYTITAYDED